MFRMCCLLFHLMVFEETGREESWGMLAWTSSLVFDVEVGCLLRDKRTHEGHDVLAEWKKRKRAQGEKCVVSAVMDFTCFHMPSELILVNVSAILFPSIALVFFISVLSLSQLGTLFISLPFFLHIHLPQSLRGWTTQAEFQS